ncbi:MAG: hypothetical protein IPH00_10520 [Flavobacteriales bacterium]|nr:hypothetical protein [Flavobacteriales bacterium]
MKQTANLHWAHAFVPRISHAGAGDATEQYGDTCESIASAAMFSATKHCDSPTQLNFPHEWRTNNILRMQLNESRPASR